jgi:hypothetical protein
VGIRLLGATSADVSVVASQLGPIRSSLDREPDVTIRFVDRLTTSAPLYLIGDFDAAYGGDSFLLLRGRRREPVRVEIPFDRIGRGCEIRCQRGATAIPLLIPIVNLCAMANGALPLHASAVRHRGKGVLFTGWSRAGKTETLLAFVANGAEYVGDEWIYVTGDGAWMNGIPEPIRVWDWHLDELPRFRKQLDVRDRARLYGCRRVAGAVKSMARGRALPGRGRRALARLGDLIARQGYTHLPPGAAFSESFGSLRAPLEHVVFVESWDTPEITSTPMSGAQLAARIGFSLREERSVLMAWYRKFRFAMPDRSNPLIDDIDAVEGERLHRVLGNRICHSVQHPYPVSIPALFDAVSSLLSPP